MFGKEKQRGKVYVERIQESFPKVGRGSLLAL